MNQCPFLPVVLGSPWGTVRTQPVLFALLVPESQSGPVGKRMCKIGSANTKETSSGPQCSTMGSL